MRAWSRLLAGLGIPLAFVIASASPAAAHALATSSVPASGAELKQAPSQIVITFTERPDPALSSIQVLDTSGATRSGGRATPVPGQPTELEIPAHGLGDGVYTVSWRTVSAVDGHLASGSFAFGVNASPAGAPTPKAVVSGTPRPSSAAVASRWVYYAGLIGLVGIAFVGLVIVRPPPSRLVRRALPAAWLLGAVGAIGVSEAARSTSGASLVDLFSSSLGRSFITRGLPLIVAGAAILVCLGRYRRAGLAAVGLAGAAAMLADVDTSHAAAASSWTWYRMGTQWVHFLAVGVWIGGLAALLLSLGSLDHERRGPAVRRFSTAAGFGLLAVAATGSLRAVDEVGSWGRLFSTGFGQIVLIKIGLLGLIACMGAVNRYRNVPAIGRSALGLRRVASAEVLVAGCALVAAAFLQNLAPPSLASASQGPPTLAPLVVSGSDYASTDRIKLTVAPGTAGFNSFRLAVSDYDTGDPVNDVQVSLHFANPARTDIGESDLALHRTGSGTYQAQGGNLAVQGTWRVTTLIQGSSTGVEIPLSVTTQVPPVKITTERNPGLPTFYDAALPGGNKLQVYLDPGHPGFNQLHAQYFDPAGQPIPTTVYSVTQCRLPAALLLLSRHASSTWATTSPTRRCARVAIDTSSRRPDRTAHSSLLPST